MNGDRGRNNTAPASKPGSDATSAAAMMAPLEYPHSNRCPRELAATDELADEGRQRRNPGLEIGFVHTAACISTEKGVTVTPGDCSAHTEPRNSWCQPVGQRHQVGLASIGAMQQHQRAAGAVATRLEEVAVRWSRHRAQLTWGAEPSYQTSDVSPQPRPTTDEPEGGQNSAADN